MDDCYDFYGYRIEVQSTRADWLAEVRRDFSYFHRNACEDGRPDLTLELRDAEPRYDDLPAMRATIITPRNVCFENDRVSYIDYFGRALAVYDRRANRCVADGTDADLMREISYLFILSMVGQHLDRIKLHRVHSLGVSYEGQGVFLLLPSGGGKSTMALKLMRQPGFRLLGEDSPLVDGRGLAYPFPLRAGVRLGNNPDIPARHLKTVRRMEFEPKTLIDVEYFAGRLSGPVPSRLLLVGERNLGCVSEIRPLDRRKALGALVKNMVVGLGLYQGLEFLLERGVSELAGKAGMAFWRLRSALALMAAAPAYKFVLGRDRDRNMQTLIDFIHRALSRAAVETPAPPAALRAPATAFRRIA